MRKIIRRSVYISILVCLSVAIVSCEEDFTDIGSNVISNTKFSTDAISVDIIAGNSPLERIQSDNISRALGEYLLGVYASAEYEKIEASIVSQLAISSGLKVIDDVYGADTTVVTKIDTVFLKLPYQATLQSNLSTGPDFELDSIIGDQTKAFTFNVYQSNTFINLYNPVDPTKINRFYSNDVFEKTGTAINAEINYQFKPNLAVVGTNVIPVDTVIYVKRRTSTNLLITTDTIKYSSSNNGIPLPFASVALDEDKIKQLFLDKYESSEFASQDAFNDYFRGIILEASGNDGALYSFNFNDVNFKPSIEIYYTNTVLKQSSNDTIKTVRKNNSFQLSGFRVNTFKMDDKVYPVNDQIIIQGAAGSEGDITLFNQNKIDELKAKNWLVNDASLTLYINQSADTNYVPNRLYLYKNNNGLPVPGFSQIKDAISEASFGGISGILERDSNGKAEKYTFKITDYISDILNGNTSYSPTLKLKVYNPSDLPTSSADTIFKNYSWKPKAVTLFNNSATDVNKKAVLKISYSEKK